MPIHAAVFAALSGLLLTTLGLLTSRLRIKYKVLAGFGDHLDLQRMSRAHGVALERLLPAALLLLLFELCGGSPRLVDGFGAVLLGARLMHLLAALRGSGVLARASAMTVTYGGEAALAIALLSQALRRF